MIKVWKHLDYQATEYKFVFPKNEPNRIEAPPTWELCNVLTDCDLKRVAQEAWDSGVDAYRQYSEYGVRLTFDEYWAEQQAREGRDDK